MSSALAPPAIGALEGSAARGVISAAALIVLAGAIVFSKRGTKADDAEGSQSLSRKA